MNMQKEWSSFRLTLIPYLVLLILPFSFYFVYTSFKTMQQDTKIVRQSSWIAGAVGHITHKNDQHTIQNIDKTLQRISIWGDTNNDTKLYIGAHTLLEDLAKITSCWTQYKNDLSSVNTQCYTLADNLALNIEKMVYLKQKNIINIFYMSLAIAMIFALIMIYFVRTYIHIQMKKHAIHDYETNLFNKKYFLSELKTSCARSARHNYPLSMLSIFIHNFETAGYDKKSREHILKVLGGMVTSLTRTSDVACRYDENQLSILLTDTEKENALFLEGRIREALEKHDFDVSRQLNFKFSTIYFNTQETSETFVSRTQDLLK